MVYETKYQWRHNNTKVPAQVAGEVMEMIEQRDGTLTKEAFLEESRPENAPTHGCFEWDDSIAAEKYRLEQSRHAIQDIMIVVKDESGEKHTSPGFLNVSVKSYGVAGTYKTSITALTEKESRQIVLQNAIAELDAFKRKYQNLKELRPIFEAIAEVTA